MKLGGVFEIIVYCEDMATQVAFYRDTLGLEITYPTEVRDFGDQHWVTFDTGACTLALHSGGDGEPSPSAPKFVFATDDVVEAREELEEVGVPVTEIRRPAPGVEVFDGRDPEGNYFSVERNAHIDIPVGAAEADGPLTEQEREEVADLVAETMAKRNDDHFDFLLGALRRADGSEEGDVDVRRKIYRALCFVDHDRARDALTTALQTDSNDAIDPIVEGIWKQQYLLLKVLPGELLANYQTEAGDARYARRLITILQKHRATEKIGSDWLADAPEDLEKKVTPRPLWA